MRPSQPSSIRLSMPPPAQTTSRLLALRKERMSVYVIVPPNRLADATVLLNLFYSQLLNLNTKGAAESGQDAEVPVPV